MQLKYRVRDWLSSESVQLSIGALLFAFVSWAIFSLVLDFHQPIYATLIVLIALLAIRTLREIAKTLGGIFYLIVATKIGFEDELGL